MTHSAVRLGGRIAYRTRLTQNLFLHRGASGLWKFYHTFNSHFYFKRSAPREWEGQSVSEGRGFFV